MTLYITEGSLSHSDDVGRRMRIRQIFLEKRAKDSPKSRNLFARYFYYSGRDYIRIGQVREARRYFLKAFFYCPVKVEYFGKFLRTYFEK